MEPSYQVQPPFLKKTDEDCKQAVYFSQVYQA